MRAVMTAHWMKQMGWDVAAMTVDMRALGRETGAWMPRVLNLDSGTVPTIAAATLRQRMQAGGISVVDVDWSRDYREGHIPGAWYGIRARLDAILPQLPSSDTVVFTSRDGVLARLAAADAKEIASMPVLALEGGTAAWREAGFPLEQGATRMATSPDDIRLPRANRRGTSRPRCRRTCRGRSTWPIRWPRTTTSASGYSLVDVVPLFSVPRIG